MSVQEITVDELAEVLDRGARLIDVREPYEYEEARVPGGALVPLATVPAKVDDIRGDGPVYVICKAGVRSMHACDFLTRQGIEAVNVAGGVLAWIATGREYVSGPA